MKWLAAACLLIAPFAAPALAQETETPNPLDVLLDAFESPEGQQFVAQFIREPTGAASLEDPVGDFEHSSGEAPGFTPPHIDILDTWALELDPGEVGLFGPTDANHVWAPIGVREVDPPSYEPFHTFTGDQAHDGSQYGSGAVLFGFTLVETPPPAPPGRCEYVVWINDSARGETFVRNPSFPLDPAGDTNVAFGLGLNPEGGPGLQSAFALELQESGGFAPVFEADVRALITPRYVGITVPRQLIGEITAVNFYSFCVEEDFGFEAGVSGADQTGLIPFTPEEFGFVQFASVDVPISTTTTQPATTTTQPLATTTTAPVLDGTGAGDDAGFPWWFVLIAGGVGIALAGWWLYGREDDPCKELLEAWMTAEEACAEAQDAADETADECEKAELELAGLEDERKEICKTWPPACWDTEEGDWIEDERGNRITSRDIHMRRVALGDVWAEYKAGKLSAGEVEAKWREMDTPGFRAELGDTDAVFKDLLDAIDDDIAAAERRLDERCVEAERASERAHDACDAAEQARLAYERCVGQAVAARDGQESGGGAAVAGESPTSGTPSGEPSDPCRGIEGKREARPAGDPEKTLVFVDFSVITGVSEGSERNVAAGNQLAIDLSDLATELDFAGDLLNARSAGLHIGGAVNGYSTGKYAVTSSGLVKGGIDAAMATIAVVPEVPTTPVQAGLEGLETMARLGSVIASKVTEWMTNVQIMTVRLTMFYQDITATPYEIWECTGERGWVCLERVWEIEVSGLRRLLGQDRIFTVNSEIRRREFERVIQGLAHRAATTIRRDAESLARWRSDHETGPCP